MRITARLSSEGDARVDDANFSSFLIISLFFSFIQFVTKHPRVRRCAERCAPEAIPQMEANPRMEASDDVCVLLTWGDGSYGALGHGERLSETVPRVVLALVPTELRGVSCGSATTFALTADGAFSFGAAVGGVLGQGAVRGDTSCVCTPQRVTGLRGGLTSLACGDRHALAAGEGGELYAWGDGGDGRLWDCPGEAPEPAISLAVDAGVRAAAASAQADSSVAAVACGSVHSLALTRSGVVFSWGPPGAPQLGHGVLPISSQRQGGRTPPQRGGEREYASPTGGRRLSQREQIDRNGRMSPEKPRVVVRSQSPVALPTPEDWSDDCEWGVVPAWSSGAARAPPPAATRPPPPSGGGRAPAASSGDAPLLVPDVRSVCGLAAGVSHSAALSAKVCSAGLSDPTRRP